VTLPCDILLFKITGFSSLNAWKCEITSKKVSFKAQSCSQTRLFTFKSIKSSVLKSKKSLCDTLSNTPLPFECHVLFECPRKLFFKKSGMKEAFIRQQLQELNNFFETLEHACQIASWF